MRTDRAWARTCARASKHLRVRLNGRRKRAHSTLVAPSLDRLFGNGSILVECARFRRPFKRTRKRLDARAHVRAHALSVRNK